MMPELSIGQIVHYRSYGTPKGEYLSESRAAIITYVHSEKVFRLLFLIQPVFFLKNISTLAMNRVNGRGGRIMNLLTLPLESLAIESNAR